MKLPALILMAALPMAAAHAAEVKLQGPVVGFRMHAEEATRCFMAIEDPSNNYYNSGYHHIDNKAMCSMAKAAFMTGITVVALTKVESRGDTNSISKLEMVRAGAGPYWPPYGRRP
jgi:hypothetical protein